jgi:hypothetical protein
MINKLILYRLMGLLNRVTLFVDANKMTPNNVAIVFAPNILRPPNEDVAMVLRGCAAGNHLVRCMIEDYDIIFGEVRLFFSQLARTLLVVDDDTHHHGL